MLHGMTAETNQAFAEIFNIRHIMADVFDGFGYSAAVDAGAGAGRKSPNIRRNFSTTSLLSSVASCSVRSTREESCSLNIVLSNERWILASMRIASVSVKEVACSAGRSPFRRKRRP